MKIKVFTFIWSLSSSYDHIKCVSIYGKKTLSCEEVSSKTNS